MRLTQCVPFEKTLVHAVIADVTSYPLFIPGVVGVRVLTQSPHTFDADLDIKVLGKKYTYRSFVEVENNSVKAKAATFMGNLNVSWFVRETSGKTYVDFHLTTTIPGFDWLMPSEWPSRVMQAFIKRCEDLAQ